MLRVWHTCMKLLGIGRQSWFRRIIVDDEVSCGSDFGFSITILGWPGNVMSQNPPQFARL